MDRMNLLEQRFNQLYAGKRLLGIQLNGFSHKVFYDNGSNENPIEIETYSAYMPESNPTKQIVLLFNGIPHHEYQGDPIVYVYIER